MAVPSRVSVLIFYTNAESGLYSRDSSRCPQRRPYIFCQHHTPSGQSRVYRGTELRTDDVHCRESAGTRPVVLKVVRGTGAAFASPWTTCYCLCSSFFPRRLLVYSEYVQIIGSIKILILLYCCTVLWNRFFPPTYGLYGCKESSVHGTILSVVCQNIISSVILLYYGPIFSPPTYVCTRVKSSVHTVQYYHTKYFVFQTTPVLPLPTSVCTCVKI